MVEILHFGNIIVSDLIGVICFFLVRANRIGLHTWTPSWVLMRQSIVADEDNVNPDIEAR